MFESGVLTNLLLVILIAGVAAVLISILVLSARVIRARKDTPNTWDWLKDLWIPITTPIVVLVLGGGFAVLSDHRQQQETERQRQTSFMRELIVSQDRVDTSFLLAVDAELRSHLDRYVAGKAKHKKTDFDEEAAFFFYSMHRAAVVDLHATEGNLVFPRLWMENAFDNLAGHVVESILGTTELDPETSAEGEAVTYQYFGGHWARNPAGKENAGKPYTGPLLFTFHCLLDGIDPPGNSVDTLQAEILRAEFHRFQARLRNEQFSISETIETLRAMDALDVYAYNHTFADWYGIPRENLDENPAPQPPRHFSPSSPQDVRKRMWDLILRFSR